MKATELQTVYKNFRAASSINEATRGVLESFIKDLEIEYHIRVSRDARMFLALFREFNDKWDALVRLEPELPSEGFRIAVEKSMPMVAFLLVKEGVFDRASSAHDLFRYALSYQRKKSEKSFNERMYLTVLAFGIKDDSFRSQTVDYLNSLSDDDIKNLK